MNEKALRRLFDEVCAGRLTIADAISELRWLPYADLGFAKADTHRPLRRGAAEAVYCPGKTTDQIVRIAAQLSRGEAPVLLTRIAPDVAAHVIQVVPSARHVPEADLVIIGTVPARGTGRVGVLSGGTGDIRVAEEAAWTAEAMGAAVSRVFDVGVSGLHRLGAQRDLLERARVLVVVAGMDGALPAVVAGLSRAPVIGVPTSVGYGAHLGGVAPLLTMLSTCAPGVSVVNIDNGFGAGYIAAMINGEGGTPATVDGSDAEIGRADHQKIDPREDESLPRRGSADPQGERLVLLETSIDDMSPQFYPHVTSRLLDAGALEVTTVPAVMKKGRPGHILRVLARPECARALAGILFAETTTIGVRTHDVTRMAASRRTVHVDTEFGPVPVKVASDASGVLNLGPEFEVCRELAERNYAPLKRVMDAACRAAALHNGNGHAAPPRRRSVRGGA